MEMYFLDSRTLKPYTLKYIFYHFLNKIQLKYQNKFFTNFQIFPFSPKFQSVLNSE